jgi:hypothetical protein
MFASCELPHGKRAQPLIFIREALGDDVAEHMGIPTAQALAASEIILGELRGLIPDHDAPTVCLSLESPDLRALLGCLS